MARRGGRRGRRSRSKQRSRGAGTRSSKAKSSKSRSRNTRGSGARKSAPSKRRNTRTTSRPSNRRANVSKKRQATRSAPKRAVNASRGKAPTSRRQATRVNRQSKPTVRSTLVAKNQGPSSPIKNYGGKMLPNTGAGRPGNVRLKPKFQIPTPTAFMNSLMGIQAANAQGPMKPKLTREEQIKARFPGASPNSAVFGMTDAQLSQPGGPFNQAGPGGPEKESNYTSYQPGSFYNQSDTNVNVTNALRSGRNLITAPARALGINTGLTNRLIPKSNEAIQDSRDQRGPRRTLTRPKSRGGSSRIEQQVAAQQIQPEIAPTIGTPAAEEYIESAAPQGDLTRIQSQAYNTQLTSSLAGMFGGQGSVGYTPQGSPELSPTLRAGQSRGRRRVRLFGARRRRGGTGDQFSRAGDRIAKLTNINV